MVESSDARRTPVECGDLQRHLLEAITSCADMLVAAVDTEYRYLFMNDAYREEVRRLSGKEIGVGLNMLAAFAHMPEEQRVVAESWGRVLRGESVTKRIEFGAESRYRRTYSVRHTPVRDGEGAVIGAAEVAIDITDQVRTEEAIRTSESQLHLFIEHAPAALAIFDTGMRYIKVSKKWLRRYDLGEDIIGKTTYETFPNMPENWKEAHRRGLAGEVVRAEEDSYTHPDGSTRWERWEVRPWYDTSGKVGGIAIFAEDVTAAIATREALRKSERIYRAIGESMDYGVWVCEPDGRNIYASESFLNLVGITQEQCSDFGWGDVLHPDDAERTIAAWKECVRTGGKWNIEHRFRGVDGQWHEILARGVQIRGDDGEVLCWAGINLDISELKKTERSLEEALSRLNSHMENTPLAVVERDADFLITRWAGAAPEMFGWSAEEAVGKDTRDLGLIPEEHLPTVENIMAGLANGTKRRAMNANPNRRKDGSLIECAWYSSALYDESGKMLSTLSLVLDVTRRNQLERDLIAAKDAAEAANRAKSEFLARMSHELRTPMNGAIGMIELALRQGVDSKAREYLGLAKQSSRALVDIINDILDLARIEAGRIELESAPFRFGEVVREVADILGAAAAGKGIRLTVDVAPEVPPVLLGDAGRLRQVLLNVVGNGVKFTAKGHVAVSARLSPGQPEGGRVRLVIAVEDTGIGIPPGQLETVFDSFSEATVATHPKYGGTGLGLSISKQLLSLMGGEIRAESQPGVGSTFTFTAEFGLTDEVRTPEAERRRKKRTAPGSRRLKILLAEDNPVNRFFAQTLFEEEGHAVWLAENGKEALEALAGGGFDLVFMDIQMPEMDGVEACRRIRSGEVPGCDRNIPVIAMTAHVFPEDREKFLAAGMNGTVSKPLDLQELDGLLKQWSLRPAAAGGASQGAPPGDPGLERARERFDELMSRFPKAKVWALLDNAMGQIDPALDRLVSLVELGDARGLAAQAHRLRGTWTVLLGTDRMIELAAELERRAANGSLEGAHQLVDGLKKEFSGLKAFLRSRMG